MTRAIFGWAVFLSGISQLAVPGVHAADTYLLTDHTVAGANPISQDIGGTSSFFVGRDASATINTSPTADFVAGASGLFAQVYNASTVNIHEATLDTVFLNDPGVTVNVDGPLHNPSGGTAAGNIRPYAGTFNLLSGGTIGGLGTFGTGVGSLLGGSLDGFDSHDSSSVDVHGGLIGSSGPPGLQVFAYDQSVVTFFGTGLSLSDATPLLLSSTPGTRYRLTGTLENGDSIDTYVFDADDVNPGPNILLVSVPEPASWLLMTVGVVTVGLASWRRRQQHRTINLSV